jgi:hypothetical protein
LSRISLPDDLPISTLATGTIFWRIHKRIHDVKYFDRSSEHRFNAAAGEYGVCYVGDSLEVSFLETFVQGSRYRVVPCL